MFLEKQLSINVKRNIFNWRVCILTTYGCQKRSLTRVTVEKLETTQELMEGKMLCVKLKDNPKHNHMAKKQGDRHRRIRHKSEMEIGRAHHPDERQ